MPANSKILINGESASLEVTAHPLLSKEEMCRLRKWVIGASNNFHASTHNYLHEAILLLSNVTWAGKTFNLMAIANAVLAEFSARQTVFALRKNLSGVFILPSLVNINARVSDVLKIWETVPFSYRTSGFSLEEREYWVVLDISELKKPDLGQLALLRIELDGDRGLKADLFSHTNEQGTGEVREDVMNKVNHIAGCVKEVEEIKSKAKSRENIKDLIKNEDFIMRFRTADKTWRKTTLINKTEKGGIITIFTELLLRSRRQKRAAGQASQLQHDSLHLDEISEWMAHNLLTERDRLMVPHIPNQDALLPVGGSWPRPIYKTFLHIKNSSAAKRIPKLVDAQKARERNEKMRKKRLEIKWRKEFDEEDAKLMKEIEDEEKLKETKAGEASKTIKSGKKAVPRNLEEKKNKISKSNIQRKKEAGKSKDLACELLGTSSSASSPEASPKAKHRKSQYKKKPTI